LLEQHKLGEELFAAAGRVLQESGSLFSVALKAVLDSNGKWQFVYKDGTPY
jgi:16S rRNA G1207 methylase RsmC